VDPVFQKHWITIITSVGLELAGELRCTGYSRNTVSMKNIHRGKLQKSMMMRKDQKGVHRRLVKSACGSNVPITSTAIDLVKI